MRSRTIVVLAAESLVARCDSACRPWRRPVAHTTIVIKDSTWLLSIMDTYVGRRYTEWSAFTPPIYRCPTVSSVCTNTSMTFVISLNTWFDDVAATQIKIAIVSLQVKKNYKSSWSWRHVAILLERTFRWVWYKWTVPSSVQRASNEYIKMFVNSTGDRDWTKNRKRKSILRWIKK